MRSAARLVQSRAWVDESQGRRLPGRVFTPLGGDSKARQAPDHRALPLAAPSVLDTFGSGTHSVPVPGPRLARVGDEEGTLQCPEA